MVKSMQFPSLIEKMSISLNTELPNQICRLSLLRKRGSCHHAVYPSICQSLQNFIRVFFFLPISVIFEEGAEVSMWLQKGELN